MLCHWNSRFADRDQSDFHLRRLLTKQKNLIDERLTFLLNIITPAPRIAKKKNWLYLILAGKHSFLKSLL